MAYIDTYNVAVDPASTLLKRSAVALHRAATDVSNEATNTPNYANRRAWALKVTLSNNGPILESHRWIWKILENSTVAADPLNVSDANLQNAVNGLIDIMANRG